MKLLIVFLLAISFVGAGMVLAQAPGVPVESVQPLLQNEQLLEKAKALRETGRLLPAVKITEMLKLPQPCAIQLPVCGNKVLRGREVAEHARHGYVRVGWYFLCPKCDHWHLALSGGYAIAKNAVVTCHHCVQNNREMREGYFVAVDFKGNVLPVTAVLAKSQSMDAAILRVEGGEFTPLPLNESVAPGDPAYCLSDPLEQLGYFSTGIVNRFFWRPDRHGAPGSIEELKALRVNVSTDWAPGSSGAAVLDECGNVIGHVSAIAPMAETGRAAALTPAEEKPKVPEKSEAPKPQPPRDRFGGAVLITLHEAVPARSILALVKSMVEAKPAEPPAK